MTERLVDNANENGYRFCIMTKPLLLSAVADISPEPAPAAGSVGVPRVESAELLGERGELVIAHEGREYRLRRTQSGKLILTA